MVKRISERIGIVKLKINENTKNLIIQVYAPTAEAEEETIKTFYADLKSVIKDKGSIATLKVREEKGGSRNVGKYGLGKRNKRGKN